MRLRKLTVTEDEQAELERLGHGKDRRIGDMCRIVLCLHEGSMSRRQLAKSFRVDKGTISRTSKSFVNKKSIEDWLAVRTLGSKCKLTDEQQKDVFQYVDEGLIEDVHEVVRYIKEKHGKSYSPNGAARLLRRLGFVYKRTTLIPGKFDEEKQAAWVQGYEHLRDNLPEDEVITFADGCHPSHNVQPGMAWIVRGKEKHVRTNTGRKRVNINGVLDIQGMRAVIHVSDTINAESTIALFNKVQEAYPDKRVIHVITDNARYYKNKAVTAYLEAEGCRIDLIFLPPYSPNLNLIERLWHYLHKHIIGSQRRETFAEFQADILTFFEDDFAEHEPALRKFIGTKMHLIHAA